MIHKGTVKNGVIVLPPDVQLPEGTAVDVTPPEDPAEQDSFVSAVLKLAKPRDWPDDLAMNHDYYLHGHNHKQQPQQGRWIAGEKPAPELTEQQAIDDVSQLASLAAETTGLPADLASNHDHYLHGLPRQ